MNGDIPVNCYNAETNAGYNEIQLPASITVSGAKKADGNNSEEFIQYKAYEGQNVPQDWTNLSGTAIDLTPYSGKEIRIVFRLADRAGNVSGEKEYRFKVTAATSNTGTLDKQEEEKSTNDPEGNIGSEPVM